MLIVLEGIDGGGKTRTADRLEELHDGPVTRLKKSQPDNEWPTRLAEYEKGLLPYLDDIRSPDHLVIMDRWHTGESIYGPLYRGESGLTSTQVMHIELVLQALGGVRVLVQPPLDSVRKRLEERGETFLAPEDVATVHACYSMHGRLYGYHRVGGCKSAKVLLGLAKHAQEQVSNIAGVPGYIGSSYPSVLLVGDQPGGQKLGDPEFPWAFTPLPSSSGVTLLGSMMQAGLGLKVPVGVVNSLEPRSDHPLVNLKSLHEATGKPYTVALGSAAALRLRDAAVPHIKELHPQYVRRFGGTGGVQRAGNKSTKAEDYVIALRRAAAHG